MNDTTQQNDTTHQRGGFFTIAAWQRADDLAVKVYQVTQSSPPSFAFWIDRSDATGGGLCGGQYCRGQWTTNTA